MQDNKGGGKGNKLSKLPAAPVPIIGIVFSGGSAPSLSRSISSLFSGRLMKGAKRPEDKLPEGLWRQMREKRLAHPYDPEPRQGTNKDFLYFIEATAASIKDLLRTDLASLSRMHDKEMPMQMALERGFQKVLPPIDNHDRCCYELGVELAFRRRERNLARLHGEFGETSLYGRILMLFCPELADEHPRNIQDGIVIAILSGHGHKGIGKTPLAEPAQPAREKIPKQDLATTFSIQINREQLSLASDAPSLEGAAYSSLVHWLLRNVDYTRSPFSRPPRRNLLEAGNHLDDAKSMFGYTEGTLSNCLGIAERFERIVGDMEGRAVEPHIKATLFTSIKRTVCTKQFIDAASHLLEADPTNRTALRALRAAWKFSEKNEIRDYAFRALERVLSRIREANPALKPGDIGVLEGCADAVLRRVEDYERHTIKDIISILGAGDRRHMQSRIANELCIMYMKIDLLDSSGLPGYKEIALRAMRIVRENMPAEDVGLLMRLKEGKEQASKQTQPKKEQKRKGGDEQPVAKEKVVTSGENGVDVSLDN